MTQDHKGRVVNPEMLDLEEMQDHLAIRVLLERKATPDLLVLLVNQDSRDQQDL